MRLRLVLAALALPAALASSALAQDSDGDGVNDGLDARPCDPTTAGVAYAPAERTHGLLQFEDEWPAASDLDFNDVVVAYHYAIRTNAAGAAVSMQVDLHVLALGGTYSHGLGLHLPVPASRVASVTRTVAGGATTDLTARGADAEFTVDVQANLRSLFGDRADQINSVAVDPVHTSPAIRLDITFTTPTPLDAAAAPYDLFIYRVDAPGHEIHRPAFAGTAAMDTGLFGTGRDASTPARSFVDDTGLPYALSLPEVAPYAQESVPVSGLFPNITQFAASGGQTHGDFYRSSVDTANAFPAPVTPAFVSAAAEVDRACLPVGAPCANLAARGQTNSGVYLVDPDGNGGLAPFEVYCDMNLDGGGWTLISNRRANTTNTEACGGNIRNFFTNGCGSATAIGASDSYALNASRRAAVIANATEMLIVQYLNGVPDFDDAYIVQLATAGQDLFPNRSSVTDFRLGGVCTYDRTRCDVSGVYFKHAGDSWYHSSLCRASNWANNYTYRGNYGLCHDAWTGASSSYFTGNRVGYNETKLWAHPNGAAAYQERIFYR